MSDDPKIKGGSDARPEETLDPNAKKAAEEKGEKKAKKSPLFKMARLDGRDTLKYEDTADK